MYAEVFRELRGYAEAVHKPSPRLLAVSKTKPVTAIQQAYREGAREFGENYVQEALEKIQLLPRDCVWHLIGPLQSNKTGSVAEHFDWVQSLDRLKIARRLSEQRDPAKAALQVCIEVNIDGEANKAGCRPEKLLELVHKVCQLPRLALRGLMVIPRLNAPQEQTRASFLRAAALFSQCKIAVPDAPLDTLSMGMSGDWRSALDCGSSMVRMGTAIFGARPPGQRGQ